MRSEKIAIKREVQQEVDAADYMFVVEYTGMNVTQADALRRQLRKDNGRLRFFKNTFLRQAVAERNWPESICDDIQGMVAVVVGDDPVAAARSLKRFGAEHKVPVMRGGVLEDCKVSAADLAELASLPSRDQLRAQVVGALAAPLTGLLGTLSGVQSKLVRVLKAVEDKKSAA